MSPSVQVIVDQTFLRDEVNRIINEKLADMGVGTWWDMKRLEYETSRSSDWIRENILFDSRLHVPGREIAKQFGNRWMFKAKEMSEFLDRYFDGMTR